MLELLLVCARTVWRKDIRVAEGNMGEHNTASGMLQDYYGRYVVKDVFLCLTNGPVLQFKDRSDKSDF